MGGGGGRVHLLSSLVLLISIAQVSAQSLHPVSRATCGRKRIGVYVHASNTCTGATFISRLSPLQLSL